MISCQTACVEDGPGKGGCAVSTCNQGCDDTCEEVCADSADGSGGRSRDRRVIGYSPKEVNVTIGETSTQTQNAD